MRHDITLPYELDEQIAANLLYWRRIWNAHKIIYHIGWINFVLFGVLILIHFIFHDEFCGIDLLSVILFISFGVTAALIDLFWKRNSFIRGVRDRFRASNRDGQSFRLIFEDDEISLANQDSSFRCSWDLVDIWTENKEFLLCVIERHYICYIPKSKVSYDLVSDLRSKFLNNNIIRF